MPATQENGSIDASQRMLSENQSGSEHTLAGKLIGVVREHTFGKGSAQSNDQIATIAADTISALPIVKSWVGGLARAGMLVDPTKNITQNLSGFGLNFAEGFALNKVSNLYNPESSLSQFAAAKFGTGLAGESATHLAVGFGFGAVRAGFSPESWKDGQGNFSLGAGAEHILKDGAIGSAINLPAGLLGSRIARASGVLMTNEAISPRLANTIAGIGSGYAAGGVFGGLGAVMAGQSLPDVLKAANEGGVIGAITGGAMGGIQSTAHMRDIVPVSQRGQISATAEAGNASRELPTFLQSKELPTLANRDSIITDRQRLPNVERHGTVLGPDGSLEIQVRGQMPIAELAKRLISEGQSERKVTLPVAGEGPWTSADAYAAQSTSRIETHRDYAVEGHIARISVPESYAAKLDEVRALRMVAEQPNAILDNLTPVELQNAIAQVRFGGGGRMALANIVGSRNIDAFRPILEAKGQLEAHALGKKALPEDLIPLLDELPIKGPTKRIYLTDQASFMDPYFSKLYNEDFKSAASAAASTGEVWFHNADRATQPQTRNVLREHLVHEDGHLNPSDKGLYAEASKLEKDYYTSEYSKKNDSERHSEDRSLAFLHPDSDAFTTFADKAPIRTAVMARDLAIQMGSKSTAEQSIYAPDYWNRIKYVQDNVLPIAQKQLEFHVEHGSLEEKTAAMRLLGHLGNETSVPTLMKVAHRYSYDDQVAMGGLDASLEILGSNRQAQFRLLWNEAQPDMPFTDTAIKRMRYLGTQIETAAPSARLLEMYRDRDMHGIARQIRLMPDQQGKQAAFGYALELGMANDNDNYLRSLALTTLQNEPTLRVDALHLLGDLDTSNLSRLVNIYRKTDPEPSVREAANEVYVKALAADARQVINNGRFLDPQMMSQLADAHVMEAIPALLKTARSGPASNRGAAVSALESFNPAVVKYYMRQVKHDEMLSGSHGVNVPETQLAAKKPAYAS